MAARTPPKPGPFLAEAQQQLREFLSGPWTPVQVAAIAGVPVGTIWNWATRPEPRGYLTAAEWAKDELRETDPDAPRTFTTSEMFQACVLAELGRYGITPAKADSYLVNNLTRQLLDRTFGRRRPGTAIVVEAPDFWAPGYLVAERRNENAPLSLQDRRTAKDLRDYFADTDSRRASLTWLVIDVGGFVKRIFERINMARKPEELNP